MKKKDIGFWEKYKIKWVITISVITFFLSGIFSVISERLVTQLNLVAAFFVLIGIILTGIIFDIIGIAVTTAEEKPFHAMAANKVQEAKYAIKLVRNASQVSNFCNDVIGDISGIISGAIGTNIVFSVMTSGKDFNEVVLSLLITSFIASLTVGGKALGKSFAMIYYENILFIIAKIFYFLEGKLGLKILK